MQNTTVSKLFSGLSAVLLFSVALVACDERPDPSISADDHTIQLDVYKSPSCKCCAKWIEHLDPQEFNVSVHNRINMGSTKVRYEIAPEHQSCHTAVSESGYYFEGHIPAKFMKQFLSDPPDNVVGLAVPGMPVGSPGMESGNRFTPYQVLQIHQDGSVTVFAEIQNVQDQFE